MRTLQAHGYRVFPVNPQITGEHVHGEYVWRELAQIGEPIDLVDIFRNSAAPAPRSTRRSRAGAKAGMDAARRDRRGGGGACRSGGAQGRDGRCPAIEIPRLGIDRIEPAAT